MTDSIEVSKPKGKAQAKGWVCKLSGDATRNDAEQHKGLEIWVSKDNLPVLSADEVYHHQLMGCRVVNNEGIDFGVIDTVMETGANDVLVIQADEQSVDDQERLIPWLDHSVLAIDLVDCVIRVDWGQDY